MNKLNALGLNVLQHKMEYNKDYPDIVKNALMDKVKDTVKIEVYSEIQEPFESVQFTISEFKKTLLKPELPFAKTKEELLEEFEKLKITFEEYFSSKLKFDLNFEQETFYYTKTFALGEDFIKKYFTISDSKIPELMSKGGFFQKFAILRLPKLIEEITPEDYNGDKFKIETSSVFFDKEDNTYGIDLMINIKVEEIEEYLEEDNTEALESISEEIEAFVKETKDGFLRKI